MSPTGAIGPARKPRKLGSFRAVRHRGQIDHFSASRIEFELDVAGRWGSDVIRGAEDTDVADLSVEINNSDFARRGTRLLLDQELQHRAGCFLGVDRVVLSGTMKIQGEDGEKQARH